MRAGDNKTHRLCERLPIWVALSVIAFVILFNKAYFYNGHRNNSQNRIIPRPSPAFAALESTNLCAANRLGQSKNFTSPRCGAEVYENGNLLYEYMSSQKSRHPAFHASNLEIYVRFRSDRLGEARSSLLPSLQLFWPAAHVVAVLDLESQADAALARRLPSDVGKEFPPLCLRTTLAEDHKKIIKTWPKWNGYHRQRLDMLYADQIVKAKYVGFVDTDTFFVAPVEPQGIFTDDGRPIVQASLARTSLGKDPNSDIWWRASIIGEFLLKKPQVMNCMAYFPVVFATKHIREMRQYVARVHGRLFHEAVRALYDLHSVKVDFWCHYSVMCNYVWYFKRGEYAFYFSNVHDYKPGWDKPMRGQVSDFSFLKHYRTAPFVRMSTHFSYVYFGELAKRSDGYGVDTLPQIGHLHDKFSGEAAEVPILRCFCHVAMVHCRKEVVPDCPQIVEKCLAKGVTKDKLNFFLFRFEQANFRANVTYMQTREFDHNAILSQRWYYDSLQRASGWLAYAKTIIKAKHCTISKQLF